jgi:hypothetical protein
MRLILATMGTLGDHLPMLGLGAALQRQGYMVRIACNPAMHELARRTGLAVLPFGEAVGPEQAALRSSHWDHWLRPPELVVWNARYRQRITDQVLALLEILRPDDVLVGTSNLQLLALVARVSGCRWVEVGLNSGSMIDYAQLGASRHESHPWTVGLDQLQAELRERLLGVQDDAEDPPPLLRLHAVPESFVPSDYPQVACRRTGFWFFEDPLWQDWSPPPALERLLAESTGAFGLAFSSQPLVDPATVLQQHLRVAELLGRPLILVKGWAFRVLDPAAAVFRHPALVLVEALPYRWLFPRLDVAFIHGGMGTLAAAMAGGCRLVVEPFGNDQFLNARLALDQGLGWAVHPHRFDPEQVAALLAQPATVRLSPVKATAATATAADSQGLDLAVQLFEQVC